MKYYTGIALMKKIIADRTSQIDSSGIRKVFALAADMKDPVNFSIGQPDFDVPAPVKNAAIEAIQTGCNKYSQTAGEAELITKIAAIVSTQTGWTNPNVLVASGVSGGLLLSFMSLINPGDEVIIPDPYFVMYKHLVNMFGGKCVFIDTYPNFDLNVDRIEAAITKKTKLIIVNSPCNPTGAVYSADQIIALADAARKHDIVVLSDEIYNRFAYDNPCESIAKHYEKTILLNGFSKAYAMTGWRMAYVAVHDCLKFVLEQMVKIQQYTFVCAPTPFQKAAITALDFDTTQYVDSYRKKRDLIYDGLNDKFEITKLCGAFYAFIKAPNGQTATEFVEKAIKNNLLIIPGNIFSEKDSHFRISYATTDDQIRKGIEILRSLA
jgi:aspartate aminotransferase/aminotransferase